MSNYSEVAINCGEKAYKMILDALKPFEDDKKYHYDVYFDGYNYFIHWKHVQWLISPHSSGEVMKAIMRVLDELNDILDDYDDSDDEFWDYGYGFMRIGEGINDIETFENNPEMAVEYRCNIEIRDDMRKINS